MKLYSNVFTLEYTKGTNRIDLFDFLRGVAMIIVMMQHSNFPFGWYLLPFHMPLFFFLSGMVVGGREMPSLGKYAWSKFKRLMIPYFAFGLLTILINWIYLSVAGEEYNILLATLGIITGQYGFVPPEHSGLYWFLFVMFVSDLMVFPINKCFRNSIVAKVGGAFLFLALSYLTTHFYPIPIFTIEKSFMGAAFILLGEICKPCTKYLNAAKFGWKESFVIILAILGVVVSERMNDNKILMYLNQFGNYGWFLLGAVLGIIAVILISKNVYVRLSKNKSWLHNLVMWVGFNSLVMFPVHLMIADYFLKSEIFYPVPGKFLLRFLLMFIVGIPLCNLITNYMPWMLGAFKKK